MRLNKTQAEGKAVFVLVDMGRVVAGCWTSAREAEREASSRNDLPDVCAVRVVNGKFVMAGMSHTADHR
jgi:hypothetical protein